MRERICHHLTVRDLLQKLFEFGERDIGVEGDPSIRPDLKFRSCIAFSVHTLRNPHRSAIASKRILYRGIGRS